MDYYSLAFILIGCILILVRLTEQPKPSANPAASRSTEQIRSPESDASRKQSPQKSTKTKKVDTAQPAPAPVQTAPTPEPLNNANAVSKKDAKKDASNTAKTDKDVSKKDAVTTKKETPKPEVAPAKKDTTKKDEKDAPKKDATKKDKKEAKATKKTKEQSKPVSPKQVTTTPSQSPIPIEKDMPATVSSPDDGFQMVMSRKALRNRRQSNPNAATDIAAAIGSDYSSSAAPSPVSTADSRTPAALSAVSVSPTVAVSVPPTVAVPVPAAAAPVDTTPAPTKGNKQQPQQSETSTASSSPKTDSVSQLPDEHAVSEDDGWIVLTKAPRRKGNASR